MPTGPEVSAEQLAMDLERGAVNALGTFARRQDESEEQIVGMALFYYAYSTWQGQVCHGGREDCCNDLLNINNIYFLNLRNNF